VLGGNRLFSKAALGFRHGSCNALWRGGASKSELHLRSLKNVLQMDHLRCKTPHRVRNELYMHLLGYNLICRAMTLAAIESGVCAWQVSFKGTLQTLNNFLPLLCGCMPAEEGCTALVACIAAHTVGDRPDRYEPRRVKRRPKNYKFFRRSRGLPKASSVNCLRKFKCHSSSGPFSRRGALSVPKWRPFRAWIGSRLKPSGKCRG